MSFAGTLLCGINLPKLKADCMSPILLEWQQAMSKVDPGEEDEVALVHQVRAVIVTRPFSTAKAC